MLFLIQLLMPTTVKAELLDKIAVLPFRIYMLKPMDHLVSGLQKMLIARLRREGFDLLDTATIDKSRLPRIEIADLDLVRRVAEEEGIDWVIKGSLTQIGEKISVDLAMLPRTTE
ncbi:MAG: hypothetical protein JSU78_03650, partial [Deltaproteobacteria bacterium]